MPHTFRKQYLWTPKINILGPFKLIIAGSRTITDYALCEQECQRALEGWQLDLSDIQAVISGGARGPDTLGERWAETHDILVERFLPDWDTYGKAAGHLRNTEMAEHVTPFGGCIVLWDGVSAGARSMIQQARKHKLWISVSVVG